VKKAGAAGGKKAKLQVKPKGKVKRKLNRTGKAKVKPKIVFSPTGGLSKTKVAKVQLVKKR